MNLQEFFERLNNKCVVCDGNFTSGTAFSATDDKHTHLHFWCAKCNYTEATFNNKTKCLTRYKVMHVEGMLVELSKAGDDSFRVSVCEMSFEPKTIRLNFKTKNIDAWIGQKEDLVEKINSLLILK